MPIALTRFPLDGAITVTQGYGGDASHNQTSTTNPWSIDFVASSGTPVFSVASGTVVGIRTGSVRLVGDTNAGGYGNFVTIQHAGFYATYAHLTTDTVFIGQSVVAGTQIGTSGNSGNTLGATGNHLHVHFGTGSSGGPINQEGTGNIFRAFGGGDAVPPAFFAGFFGASEVGPHVDVNNASTILSTDIFGTGNWGGSLTTDSDELHGNGANNRIFGGGGPDRLYGEGGDDFLVGGTGDDTYDGGTGIDTASFAHTSASWTINFTSGTSGTAVAQGITEDFANIEKIITGTGADSITLSSANVDNTVDGGAGSDQVFLTYAFGQGGYQFSGILGNLIISGSAGTDTFIGIETFTFSNGVTKTAGELLTSTDDYLANTNTTGLVTPGGSQVLGNIETTADRDWFRVQATQGSTYTIDLVSGSVPQIAPFLGDPEVYLYNASGQFLNSDDDLGDGLNSRLTFTATYTGAYFIGAGEHGDNATGTYRLSVTAPNLFTEGPDIVTLTQAGQTWYALGGDDRVTGTSGVDNISGGYGNDTIYGGSGSDALLQGNQGNDTIWGELGDDYIRGGQGDDILLHGNQGRDLIYGDFGNDTIRGGQDGDWLYGGDANDSIWGDLGSDYIDGGAGFDAAYFTGVFAGYSVIQLSASNWTVTHLASGYVDQLYAIETLRFDNFTI